MARNWQLGDGTEQSSEFINNVELSSETLTWSCEEGHQDVVKWLIEYTAADVNYGVGQNTPLTAACEYGHLAIVKYLVEVGYAHVNLPCSRSDTPLIMACRCVAMSVSMYLLCEVSDLNINIANRDGNTALHYAVWNSKNSYTQLHKACDRRGDVTEVLRLVSCHNINVQDNHGDTPLHKACFYGNRDIVKTLIFDGADETITNDRVQTPAHMGYKELQKLLNRESLWEVMLER